MPTEAVAVLGFGDRNGFAHDVYEIFPQKEFQIGREDVEHMLQVCDLAISNVHLSIRCVQFDEDETWGVPPIVYAENLSRNGTYIAKPRTDEPGIGQSVEDHLDLVQGSIPLTNGDRLYLNRAAGIFVCFDMQATFNRQPTVSLMAQEIEMFKHHYHVTPQVIGVGGEGKVYVARHCRTGRRLACKVIPLHDASHQARGPLATRRHHQQELPSNQRTKPTLTSRLEELRAEYHVLRDLDHPNIVTIEQVFLTTHHVYIMEELVPGGDLLSFMEYKKCQLLGDAQSAVIVCQLLKAIDYLHDHGIVHRDIKPDNILMTSWKDKTRVVLTDFGHAKVISSRIGSRAQRRMFSEVGTVGYSAPEVFKQNKDIPAGKGYSSAVDMWSLGTITALLLTGDLIFAGNVDENDWGSHQAKLRAAAACDLSVIDRNEGCWAYVGRRGKAFVKGLLVLDESQRMTAKSALEHRWIKNPVYADRLTSIYESITSCWRPRSTVTDIVRVLDTRHLKSSTPAPPSPVRPTHVKSQYFTQMHASSPVPLSSRANSEATTNRYDATEYDDMDIVSSPADLQEAISPVHGDARHGLDSEHATRTEESMTNCEVSLMARPDVDSHPWSRRICEQDFFSGQYTARAPGTYAPKNLDLWPRPNESIAETRNPSPEL